MPPESDALHHVPDYSSALFWSRDGPHARNVLSEADRFEDPLLIDEILGAGDLPCPRPPHRQNYDSASGFQDPWRNA
jgi:hypothetical protein